MTDRTGTGGRTNGSITLRESGPRSVGELDKRSVAEPDKRSVAEPNSSLGSRSCRRSCGSWNRGRIAIYSPNCRQSGSRKPSFTVSDASASVQKYEKNELHFRALLTDGAQEEVRFERVAIC